MAIDIIGGTIAGMRWMWDKAKDSLTILSSGVLDNFIPAFEESAHVIVTGHRLSERRKLFHLALSVAMGRVKQRNLSFTLPGAIANPLGLPQKVGVVPGVIMLQYSAESKEIEILIKFRYGAISNVLGGPLSGIDIEPLFTGPDDVLYGGSYDLTGAMLTAPQETKDALKQYEARPILGTTRELENPLPPFDAGTRGTFLEALTAQLLSNPCSDVNEMTEFLTREATRYNSSAIPAPTRPRQNADIRPDV